MGTLLKKQNKKTAVFKMIKVTYYIFLHKLHKTLTIKQYSNQAIQNFLDRF